MRLHRVILSAFVIVGVLAGSSAPASATTGARHSVPAIRAALVSATLSHSSSDTCAPKSLALSARARAALAASANGRRTVALRLDAGFRFNLVGVLVRLARPADPRFALFVRTSLDGSRWSTWRRVAFDPSDGLPAASAAPDNTFSAPLWVGSARYLEYRLGATAQDATARALRFSLIATLGEASSVGVATRPAASSVRGLRSSATVAPSAPTEPPIVTRVQWGADESWRSGNPGTASLNMAFVHHTDTGNDYTQAQAPAIVRGIYYYHTKVLGWDDIGYNFVIDKYGTIYEARKGSITTNVVGAQVLGFNSHSLGGGASRHLHKRRSHYCRALVAREAPRLEVRCRTDQALEHDVYDLRHQREVHRR